MLQSTPGRSVVVLPCEPEDFKDFIGSLLGKPQTLTGSFRGTFDLRREDVSHVFHLVDQRVSQQNGAGFVSFSVTLAYNDGSSVRLGSLAEFETFHEIRDVRTSSVHLSWVYVIQFPGKSHPEKQEIDLSFVVGPRRIVSFSDDAGIHHPALVYPGSNEEGFIQFRIRHTARTWGADIESLLTKQSEAFMKPVSRSRKWIQSKSVEIGLVSGLLFFGSSVATGLYVAKLFGERSVEQIREAVASGDFQEALIVYVASGGWPLLLLKLSVFTLVSLILAVVLGAWLGSSADDLSEPSFILLTRSDDGYREMRLTSKRGTIRPIVFAAIVQVTLGVLGNFLYAAFLAP